MLFSSAVCAITAAVSVGSVCCAVICAPGTDRREKASNAGIPALYGCNIVVIFIGQSHFNAGIASFGKVIVTFMLGRHYLRLGASA